MGLAWFLTNGFYGFQGTFQKLEKFNFVSSSFSGNEILQDKQLDCDDCVPKSIEPIRGNRFVGSWLGSLPVPLPENYLQGVDVQTRDFERGLYDANWQSYLLGEWKQGGWWYYYIVGLAVKVPLATWLLIGIGSLSACFWRPQRGLLLGVVCLWLPTIIFFVVVSGATGLNRYVRYCLPVLPVLFIWASQLGRLLTQSDLMGLEKRRLVFVASALLGLWLVGSSLANSPHHLSYFNEAAGGAGNGHNILCDSNVDWGQDLVYLRDWLEKNPEAKENLHLAYFGSFDPADVGITFTLPPPIIGWSASVPGMLWTGPTPGWHVVSRNFIAGHSMPLPDGNGSFKFRFFGQNSYRYFNEFQPIAGVGKSMFVFNISLEEANRVRDRLGLPLLMKNPDGRNLDARNPDNRVASSALRPIPN